MTIHPLLRRFVVDLAAGLLCVASVAGQSAESAPADAGTYRISGVLVNLVSGEPVAGGVIDAVDQQGRSSATSISDSEGRFALDHLPQAKYQLRASKRGFVGASYDEHDEYATSIVTGPGQDTSHLEFKLAPNAVVYGTVTNDEGEPAIGARVMLFEQPGLSGAGERIHSAFSTMVDDTGAYEFGGLPAGVYLVAVVAEPWYAVHGSQAPPALDVAYPVTYFDSTTQEQSATPIQLTPGMRQAANLSLSAVPALHLSVAGAHAPDGSPSPPQVQLVAFGNAIDWDGEPGVEVEGPEGGTMELSGLAPGHYLFLQGDPPRMVETDLTSDQHIDVGSGILGVTVAGQLQMISGDPVPSDLSVTLERSDGPRGSIPLQGDAPEGRFRIDAVPPGEYALTVGTENKSIAVVEVSAGSKPRAGNTVTIAEGGHPLLVSLNDAKKEIQGFAFKDRKGFPGAMMVLLPKNFTQWKALTRRDQSDSDGSFCFRDVAAGEYTVIAIEDGWPLDWHSPAAMSRYLTAGTNVTVTDKSGTPLHLATAIEVQPR